MKKYLRDRSCGLITMQLIEKRLKTQMSLIINDCRGYIWPTKICISLLGHSLTDILGNATPLKCHIVCVFTTIKGFNTACFCDDS